MSSSTGIDFVRIYYTDQEAAAMLYLRKEYFELCGMSVSQCHVQIWDFYSKCFVKSAELNIKYCTPALYKIKSQEEEGGKARYFCGQ